MVTIAVISNAHDRQPYRGSRPADQLGAGGPLRIPELRIDPEVRQMDTRGIYSPT
jgi:hypothetical protein